MDLILRLSAILRHRATLYCLLDVYNVAIWSFTGFWVHLVAGAMFGLCGLFELLDELS